MRLRVGLVVVTALVAGGFLYGHQFDINPPGALDDIWYGSALGWILVGLLAAVGFVVRRSWAFLILVGPVLAAVILAATGHQAPWEDAPAPGDGLWTIMICLSIIALGVPIAAGVLIGSLWEKRRDGLGAPRTVTD